MKIQIVDSQDRIIDVKERSEVNHDTDIYRTSALWITNSKAQVLLAKRAMTKESDPGKWGPAVAGTVEEGETYESNIYKEASEEIGLTGERFTLGPKSLFAGSRTYFCQWYTVILDRDVDSFAAQEDEVAGLAWINIDKWKNELETDPDKYLPSMQQIADELVD